MEVLVLWGTGERLAGGWTTDGWLEGGWTTGGWLTGGAMMGVWLVSAWLARPDDLLDPEAAVLASG
jgi:hypothetical protein